MSERQPGPIRVLVVAGVFASGDSDPWLLDDLVTEMARLGAFVDVVVHDTKTVRPIGLGQSSTPRVRVWSAGPTKRRDSAIGKFWNYATTAVRLHTSAFRFVRGNQYDVCIFSSIGVTSFGFPRRVRHAGIARRLVFVLWDFFPIHHIEIGRVGARWLHGLLRAVERQTIVGSDTVAVMTPRNAAFLREYHPGLRADTIVVPPWAPALDPFADAPRQKKADVFTVLYGGQLVPGRGVETLLDAAARLLAEGAPVCVVIAGWGSDASRLRRDAEDRGLSNVQFIERLPRNSYLELASTVHAGVALTVPGVSIPSFPSKIVDYCRMGLPVICCIESTSDAGEILAQSGAGLAVLAGDADGMAAAVRQLLAEHRDGTLVHRAANARRFFDESLCVEHAARQMLVVAGRPLRS